MPIPFSCPNCHEAYKVKDEMAGKRVVCKNCKNPIRVPHAGTGHSAEAESMAIAALADEPPQQDESAADVIEVECPNCIELVKFPARLAGKQAPCPACRRIVRVPV